MSHMTPRPPKVLGEAQSWRSVGGRSIGEWYLNTGRRPVGVLIDVECIATSGGATVRLAIPGEPSVTVAYVPEGARVPVSVVLPPGTMAKVDGSSPRIRSWSELGVGT